MRRKFETVAVGGTFDLLHSGHLALLRKAFEIGNHVVIGLSSDNFVKRLPKPHRISPYAQRLEDLKTFLKKNHFLDRAEIIPLHDIYGIILLDKRIEALIVSEETASRAREINEKRNSSGLSSLAIVPIKMVLSEDNYPISSTRIWFEEIDREGNLL
jgi:pantetheine-phosphate adenylyltransferase